MQDAWRFQRLQDSTLVCILCVIRPDRAPARLPFHYLSPELRLGIISASSRRDRLKAGALSTDHPYGILPDASCRPSGTRDDRRDPAGQLICGSCHINQVPEDGLKMPPVR